MEKTDILIIGASFSGLTLGHYLPKNLNCVILDKKTELNAAIESTGLITQVTHDLLAEFTDVDKHIPNRITTIGVMAPDFEKVFFSHTTEPWIYSTDTPELVKHMAETLPKNAEVRLGATFKGYSVDDDKNYPVRALYRQNGEEREIRARFIVGADGSHSSVAAQNPNLSKNKHFLAAFEKVFYGDIHLGEHPENTVYHFWFGEFSLGYGGWLSPTIIDGKKAFRLGLAKLKGDAKDLRKVDDFIEILKEKKIITIDEHDSKVVVQFCHMIPMGGALKKVSDEHSMLVGDAAGFCGAFAADGIKGSILSGKIAAKLIAKHLNGEKGALNSYHQEIQNFHGMMTYYRKQVFYRKIWDIMKSDSTFFALFDLIEREKDGFLNQFCDSKDKNRSLMRVIFKPRNTPQLIRYSLHMLRDLFKGRPKD